MCGIFGWSLRQKPRGIAKIATLLAAANDSRGGHSWGFWADGSIRKGLGAMAGARKIKALTRSSLVMAHTRYATTGAITKENAHPFVVGGIVGSHNGIVYNHLDLNDMYGRACTVDSQHIFYHLCEGIGLEDIDGYGAIEWVDVEADTHSVNLAIFNGGELAISSTPYGVIWSSDEDHLSSVLRSVNVDFLMYEIEHGMIYSAQLGELCEVSRIHIGSDFTGAYSCTF